MCIISEILGLSNYDWARFEIEQGAISVVLLPELFRDIELGDALPLAMLSESVCCFYPQSSSLEV